jgi:hypothetical protein
LALVLWTAACGGNDTAPVIAADLGGNQEGGGEEDAEDVLQPELLLPEVETTPDQPEPDAELLPGGFLWPCAANEECISGYCVETEDGFVCSKTCNEDCPKDWDCAQVAELPDPVYVCLPKHGNLCKPCLADSECIVGLAVSAWCVDYAGDGFFCAHACTQETECPGGYSCLPKSLGDGSVKEVCVRTEGECGCAAKYAGLTLETACYESNDFGTCHGTRHCVAGNLSACDAPTPQAEECNGLDDDCNDATDEGLDGGQCFIQNDYGTCPGLVECDDGKPTCLGLMPQAEECDGLDNDCDGGIDEDFGDMDLDGISDCVDPDKDGDDVLDLGDNCPDVANPGQENHDLDPMGDLCDPDDDNDLSADEEDCEPFNPAVYPGALELCDGLDQNCDGSADDGFGDADADGLMDCVDPDDDGDTVPDGIDNCPLEPNLAQSDLDSDGLGDACDPDLDGDLDPNATDCAPTDPLRGHTLQESCNGLDDDCDGDADEGFADLDKDLLADCLDPDDDNDGTADGEDNCPVTPNPSQTDLDKDGIGDACEDDTDGDLDPNPTDCAPQDPAVHHGADELCNGKDDNCNGILDEGYPDSNDDGKADCVDLDDDGDTVPDELDNCPTIPNADQADTDDDKAGNACDPDDDGDGDPDSTDCKPLDPAVFHKAVEICDAKDNDCDDLADEEGAVGCDLFYYNSDGDGYGLAPLNKCLCQPKAPYSALEAGDCDDNNASIFPSANEWCNSKDDDCDGSVDELGAIGCNDLYVDADKDGFGTGEPACLCGYPVGYSTAAGDCDDKEPLSKPGGIEQCDGKDNDCDVATDEEGALGCTQYFLDKDGDGYGVLGSAKCLCKPAPPYAAEVSGDCNDGNVEVHPSAIEVCNGLDDNCNGQLDEGVKSTFYKDNDADGFGTPNDKLEACAAPQGYVGSGTDCNDFNATINPGAAEVCNDLDDNCSGVQDEGLPKVDLFPDNDGDGLGAKGSVPWKKCLYEGGEPPAGWAKTATDCDDSDATVFPGAALICDGKDNNCDGIVDRFCFKPCPGDWPFQQTFAYSYPKAYPADLNGDGNYEVIVQSNFGFSLLDNDGVPLYDYSAANHNYSRGKAALADLDDYATFGAGIQTLEILTGDGSVPRFYKLEANGGVTEYKSAEGVYDASYFIASDIDYDGLVEFFTTTWCTASQMIRAFRFDKATKTIQTLSSQPDPDAVCAYTAGRFVADLDGDGTAEFVTGNGYAHASYPQYWAGHLFAYKITDAKTMAMAPWCAAGTCFPTEIAGIFGGQVATMFSYASSIGARVAYFQTKDPNQSNPSAPGHTWLYDKTGKALPPSPAQSGISMYPTDVDDDGVPEDIGAAAEVGLFDADKDGYPDQVYVQGTNLKLAFWDKAQKKFVENPGSAIEVSGKALSLGGAWDIDGNGRLDVTLSDEQGQVFCYELGSTTFNPLSSLPPQIPAAYRTFQWDNFEPNDGKDLNADGLPDRAVRIPSALTAKGYFYSYLTGAEDNDYFVVDAQWGGQICLTSPPKRTYNLAVYSYFDKWNNATHAAGKDGLPDGLVWSDESDKTSKCFNANLVFPNRTGEYKFAIRIWSKKGFSEYWPYWLKIPK